jgi:His-Xaa-Ser system protein HxsD
MTIDINVKEGEVSVVASQKVYRDESVRIAGHIFSNRAEVYVSSARSGRRLTLLAKRRGVDASFLEALGGEFLNELLNQEYRFMVASFNRKIADVITAQALLSARGGETPQAPVPDSDEVKAHCERLMKEAGAEIIRTMPPRIAPQGTPIPPEANGR